MLVVFFGSPYRTIKRFALFCMKSTTENLLKLHLMTKEAFFSLISGFLLTEATLRIRQLSIFLLIWRLPENILKIGGSLSPGKVRTWFFQLQGDPRWNVFYDIIMGNTLKANMSIFYHFCSPYVWTFWYSMCTELSGP